MTDPTTNTPREALRHTLATLAYRAGKTLRGGDDAFGAFDAGRSGRTPSAILAHLGDLMDWALSMAQGENQYRPQPPQAWSADVDRFYASLARFDEYLASSAPLEAPPDRLFQGPIADALTHVGQLALLRRLAGVPIRAENYFKADIAVGRVSLEQAAPRREFD